MLWQEVTNSEPATLDTRYDSLDHQAKVSIRVSL